MKLINLAGQYFGKWVVLGQGDPIKGLVHWDCECSCGNIVLVRGCNLTTGKSTQCNDCGDISRHDNQTRQDYELVRLRARWNAIMARCYNEKDRDYRFYGAKGITVCEDWHDRSSFIAWCQANRVKVGLHLHRAEKEYSPTSCKVLNPSAHSRLHAKTT